MSKKADSLEIEHNKLFNNSHHKLSKVQREWEKLGDVFKKYSKYTDRRVPYLSRDTSRLNSYDFKW